MAILPHQFDKLTSKEKAVLMIGAGLSYGIVPMATGLLPNAQKVAEKFNLGNELFAHIDIESDAGQKTAIYHYSDVILNYNPDKLEYAKQLGILDNPRWFAKVGLPLRGTTPRHRVIARLAKEKLWNEIWSFNWDTILESALEAVGFERGRIEGVKQPWDTLFDVLVTYDELAPCPPHNVLKIFKPHGCLNAMKNSEKLCNINPTKSKEIADRFMIGNNELTSYNDWWCDEPGKTFLSQIHTSFDQHVVIVGWSIPEKYFHTKLEYIMKPIDGEKEQLSIIDPYYQEGHKVITERYKQDESKVYFQVAPTESTLSTDKLFLAIQAKYSLKQLLAKSDQNSLESSSLAGALAKCDLGNANDSILAFADDFLPAWVRLCWRTGIMNKSFQAHDLRLEKQDVHIPYSGIESTRIDLEMAGKIFYLIEQLHFAWDFTTFPGGLWDYENGRLVIPLPNTDFNALYALKPLIKMVEEKIGFINELVIMPIGHQSIPASSEQKIRSDIQFVSSKAVLWKQDYWKVTYNLIDFEEII